MKLINYQENLVADVVDVGHEPSLLLLHSAGMGAAQWRSITRILSSSFSFRCVAPNQRGYGRSSPWPEGAPASPEAELALLEAVLETLPGPAHLVGHSMGAWFALELAHRRPGAIATLVLIEPVVLGLLRAPGEEASFEAVGAMIEDVLAAFARGDAAAAIERFTDYWYGAGAWAKIPLAQRLPIFARAAKMQSDVAAVWADRTEAARYAKLCPAPLILSAERSTPAAHRMAAILAVSIPGACLETIAGAGHMAPVTHAVEVAARLVRHVAPF